MKRRSSSPAKVDAAPTFDRHRLHFKWLVKLRWSSVAGQLVTILLVTRVLDIRLPLTELAVILVIEVVSNVACALWYQRRAVIAEWELAAVMVLDVALLTGLLYYTGGPANPFSFLYLVQIALAAVVLHAHWTWMLVALSFASFGLLLLHHRDLPFPSRVIHSQGMWVALGVAAAFIVHFLLRVTRALAARDRELSEARNLAARQEKLASLATMAAGAAHQLSTPLGTIAVVARELERAMGPGGTPAALDDVRLIREEVARCRLILDQMAEGAGESAGESIEAITVEELVESAAVELRSAPRVHLDVASSVADWVLHIPRRAVAQALRSLITNAQDASPARGLVLVKARGIKARGGGAQVRIAVHDRGRGMSPEIMSRAGEPFFTTKAPGRGMGLGLFLTRAVIEKLGGAFHIESQPSRGTLVVVTLPVELPSEAEQWDASPFPA